MMNTILSDKFIVLVETMRRLRNECPWDQKQTYKSLRKYILEEAYEVVESIDKENWEELGEELGDLLLQIVFQSVIGEESGDFSLESVIETLNKKLVERHPHVFSDKKVDSANDVETNWEHIKLKSGRRKSLLDGVPKIAPALLRAQRLQERAARVSFDWEHLRDVIDKVEEEIKEFRIALDENNRDDMEEEMGDLLFSLVNISRFLEISAEDSLRKSNEKFTRRFKYIEEAFDNNYEQMKNAGLTELDRKWEEAKKKEL
jgi:MazG family protein